MLYMYIGIREGFRQGDFNLCWRGVICGALWYNMYVYMHLLKWQDVVQYVCALMHLLKCKTMQFGEICFRVKNQIRCNPFQHILSTSILISKKAWHEILHIIYTFRQHYKIRKRYKPLLHITHVLLSIPYVRTYSPLFITNAA